MVRDNGPSFKYKATIIDNTEAMEKNGVKLAVSLIHWVLSGDH